MVFIGRLTTLIICFVFAACGKLTLEEIKYPSVVDFLRTEIVVGGSNIADGNSEMIVLILLKNSDNTVIPNYKPTYEINSSTGLIATECTTSDANGISVCILKSTKPGNKLFRLTNARVGLEKMIVFNAVLSGQVFGVASGAKKDMTTPAGHKVKLSAGESPRGQKSVTAGGYKVSTGVGTVLDSL